MHISLCVVSWLAGISQRLNERSADSHSLTRAWGVIPIHLMELSPGSFRTFVVGTSYQLGNLVSSASSTIEARIGERFPLPSIEKDGKTIKRYEYGTVIAIFMGCTFAYVILLTFLGPEYKGRAMGVGMLLNHEVVVVVDFANCDFLHSP